jgi:hypothetical protein
MKKSISTKQLRLSGITILIVGFVLGGIVIAQSSSRISFEAEASTSLSNAAVQSDENASGGSYLAFNTSTPPDQTANSFFEDFTGNTGLERFTWGVYHRHVAHHEAYNPHSSNGIPGVDNNAGAGGDWTGDHDLNCGDPTTQRPLTTDFEQDTNGSNGWLPTLYPHTEELVYMCRDHFMTSMGDISGFTVLWLAPKKVFSDVNSISFKVNLTNLGDRKWWKVGVVSDALYTSTYGSGWNGAVMVPGHVVSDVGSSDLNGSMEGPDRLIATWSGGASHAGRQGMAIGATKVPCGFDGGTDKATRHPVSLTDNGNGTITFNVAGSSCTTAASFPPCPCRVVFYDQNYNPDKDGVPIGHTWHWDDVQVN